MLGIVEHRVMYYFFIICYFISSESYAFEKNRALRASTLNYPPYEFVENGQAKGIAVEIIKEAVRRTHVEKVIFNFYPWKRAVSTVQYGESDILFNAGKMRHDNNGGDMLRVL